MFQIAATEQNNQFPVSRNIDENHLTARSAIDDVVEGFELGANDYLKKPFGMMELIVRLRSLAGRRQIQTAPAPQTYRIGEFITSFLQSYCIAGYLSLPYADVHSCHQRMTKSKRM